MMTKKTVKSLLWSIFAIAVLGLLVVGAMKKREHPEGSTQAKHTILGTAVSPAHYPNFADKDIREFFALATSMGGHVAIIDDWQHPLENEVLQILKDLSHSRGLLFFVNLSPLSLDPGGRTVAVPETVKGKSFTETSVRDAFKRDVLTLAAMEPDLLGLGTEENFIASNTKEMDAYISLTRENYAAIKKEHPKQAVTISFQWDIMRKQNATDLLARFKDSLDVYSFTSYPSTEFKKPSDMPTTYYSDIRKSLPDASVGISEISWQGSDAETQAEQAEFFQQLPSLGSGDRLQYPDGPQRSQLARGCHAAIQRFQDAPNSLADFRGWFACKLLA